MRPLALDWVSPRAPFRVRLLFGVYVAAATAAWGSAPAQAGYVFRDIVNRGDPTFNQELGINNSGEIAGYFGSGMAVGHPNKGYTTTPPYTSFTSENFPGSAQTQVTGLNGKGDTAGFWASAAGANNGFVEWNGSFQTLNDPNLPHTAGRMDQLLGINNAGLAVGFYLARGHAHAYQVNQATRVYTAIKVPGAADASATGINNLGDIVGTATDASGTTFGWLRKNGHTSTYQFPGGSDTQPFGVNKNDEIVGSYLDGAGVQHGFTLKSPLGPVSHWQSIDDPNGVGATTVNGVNAAGDLVGFYQDAAGNFDGMLATP